MDTKKVFELKKELSDLLESRPEYKGLQKEIENRLKNAGSQHNRLVLIHNMMMDKFYELKKSLGDLK